MKCLIIDLSKSFRLLLAQIVEARGFEYAEASTGADGFERLKETQFDLILVSMYLQDMDGVAFASSLRANPETSRIPLVMITTHEDKEQLDRAVSVGVTEIFSKKQLGKIEQFVAEFVVKRGLTEVVQGHILYVEDSRSIAAKTKILLESQGWTVDHFATAEEALEAFRNIDYDLVLTDVLLEGKMSGYGLLRELRGFSGHKNRVPVLAMTGFDDDARKIELLVAGVNDYVPKPALDQELIARVRNNLISKKQLDLIEEQYERLQEMAMKDQLTGLYNRHFLMEVVPAKLSEAKRHEISVSLVIIDADKFKNINDTYGHVAGDLVLKEIAEELKDNCRGEDVVARFGGEEFVILLSNCNERNAGIKAERLRKSIEARQPAGYNITASFGVSEYIKGVTQDFTDLFQAADRAVYQAKETGRNKVVLASQMKSDSE